MGGSSIDFNVTIGDPLLDKKLMARARYVRQFQQFKSLGFVTTLQWLHRVDLDEFLDLFTWVSVSTVLSGREQYRAFFGVDKYHLMMRNLECLIDRIAERGSHFHLHIGIKPTDEPVHQVIA